MKILLILLLLVPLYLFGQGHVGVGTNTPEHPFQVNVDSIWTETVQDQNISPHVSISGGLSIIPGSQKGAQRFLVGQTGYLSSIKVGFAVPTSATEVLIEVFRGPGPEGEFMTSKTLFNVTIGIYTINFTQPWSWVTDGDTLNVVMTPISGASCKWKLGNVEIPEMTAFHYTGSWDSLTYDLTLTTFITYTDTILHDVLKVREDKKVMINDYIFPRFDGNSGEVMSTNGNGTLSWSSPEALNVSVLQDTDQDTKVEVEATPDDDIIRMKVAGQQKMTILPNGKIGLNTTAPVSDLDIRGDNDDTDGGELQLATPSMSNFIRMFGGRIGDPHPFIAFSDQDTFHFVSTTSTWQNFTRRITIQPDGNVGIGTGNNAPAARLDVIGSLKVTDGTQGAGKILTSNATGLASWQPLPPPPPPPGTNDPSVSICCQRWMTRNLDVATYRNGDTIPQVTDGVEWSQLTTGAYCYYNNDSATYASVYGKLYNWYAVSDSRGLAPEGWYIPTDFEWTTLVNCLGGDEEMAGGPMKEAGTTHWQSPNTGATNLTGFTGLPGGYRLSDNGDFSNVGPYGYFWSSTELGTDYAWRRGLSYIGPHLARYDSPKKSGYSVRCLKN